MYFELDITAVYMLCMMALGIVSVITISKIDKKK